MSWRTRNSQASIPFVLSSAGYGFFWPGDERCWDLADQYLFGSDVLVAPVTEPGARQRPVYLPAGARWTSPYDGREYKGGQRVVAEAPLAVIPVFLRDDRRTFTLQLR